MSYETRGAMPLDYDVVTYRGSSLQFRGPRHDLNRPFLLCLGGTETFGRFIADPFPAQIGARLGRPVVNMGVPNAGLDVMLNDPAITQARARASAVVLQIPEAANMNNRFYTVHPRRNDRFIKATTLLRTIFPEVDFTEFHFTGHLLGHLAALSADRFALVRAELCTAWLARMRRMLTETTCPVHLLWLATRPPGTPGKPGASLPPPAGWSPAAGLVDRRMLDDAAATAASLTLTVPGPDDGGAPTKGMFHAPQELRAARALPGPLLHDRAAAVLASLLK